MKTEILTTTIGLAVILLGTACQPKEDDTAATEETSSNLEQYLLEEKPADAMPVAEAFANPEPGTQVTVTGEVMGRLEPFVDNRAMLVLGDPNILTTCNLMEGDQCTTPWDACCDTQEDKKKATATIQIVDNNQRPLQEGLKGLGGMKELTTLTVKGTVAEGSNSENLLINATGIHVGEHVEL
jgi:hypothetical protein